jgi:hypothetical protein
MRGWALVNLITAILDNGGTPVHLEANQRGVHPRLMEFLDCFSRIRDDQRLFPKECRSCGEEFASFSEYLCLTNPKGHGLEDCSGVMKRAYTLCYRHCPCGNTLVLPLTADVFPRIQEFWDALRDISEERGIPLVEVVAEFVAQCERHILEQNPCLGSLASPRSDEPDW